MQAVGILYILSANLAAFIPQRGQVVMPQPSIRVAGFTSRQVFCELKIILQNCHRGLVFFSVVRGINVKFQGKDIKADS